jgi:hypothetical protein
MKVRVMKALLMLGYREAGRETARVVPCHGQPARRNNKKLRMPNEHFVCQEIACFHDLLDFLSDGKKYPEVGDAHHVARSSGVDIEKNAFGLALSGRHFGLGIDLAGGQFGQFFVGRFFFIERLLQQVDRLVVAEQFG